MKDKYLVQIEFRYNDISTDEEIRHQTKISTIGIYDCFSDACKNGNNVLETMESKFKLHEFPDGRKAERERLYQKRRVISNLAYLETPFSFYLQVKELKYDAIGETLENILEAVERCKYHEEVS